MNGFEYEWSEEDKKKLVGTMRAIFDPKNDHLFTVEAALKAFEHVKIDEISESSDPPLDN